MDRSRFSLLDFRYCMFICNLCYGGPLENQYCKKGYPPTIFETIIIVNKIINDLQYSGVGLIRCSYFSSTTYQNAMCFRDIIGQLVFS